LIYYSYRVRAGYRNMDLTIVESEEDRKIIEDLRTRWTRPDFRRWFDCCLEGEIRSSSRENRRLIPLFPDFWMENALEDALEDFLTTEYCSLYSIQNFIDFIFGEPMLEYIQTKFPLAKFASYYDTFAKLRKTSGYIMPENFAHIYRRCDINKKYYMILCTPCQ
jgi:hypothetical protein